MEKRFYHTQESVEDYIKLAEGYDGRELIRKMLEFVPEGSSLLELGSGPGVDFEILQKHYYTTASDFSKVFLKRLEELFPSASFLELNAIDLVTEQKFDAIYSNKVLHHLSDAELKTSISNQSKILNPGGFICHSFWNGQGEEEMHSLYFNYHTVKEIKEFINGLFEVLHLKVYDEMKAADSILLIAKRL